MGKGIQGVLRPAIGVDVNHGMGQEWGNNRKADQLLPTCKT